MAEFLFLATADGIVRAEREALSWRVAGRGLEGHHVTSVIAREGVVLAGTREGVWRSDDLGSTWRDVSQGLSVRYVRWLAYHPDISDREFAGTEPAAVFVSHDGAAAWRACPEVAEMRDRYGWSLPYSPEAGCVRGFAFHGSRAYAAVEVGAALRSDDGGESWLLVDGSDGSPATRRTAAPMLDPDVHSIGVHPSSPDLVDAATGNGFYRSADGGRTWTRLYRCYCRAVWVDPTDSQHIILGPADGVDRNGRIEESRDAGGGWRPASGSLAVPWPNHMVERFLQVGDDLLAVLSNGEVLAAPLASLDWRPLLPEIRGVNAAAWMVG